MVSEVNFNRDFAIDCISK